MKLRTSFFNAAVLRKDITRFAPVWALYTIFSLLTLMAFNPETPREMVSICRDTLYGMSIVNFFYAGITAVMLFGDLFQSRMCNALHAFPMRREGWFLTHLVSGMLFCLVPNLLIVLITSFTLKSLFYVAFLWLAVMLLQYLLFFGIASLSALCAGSRLGMIAVYSLINFLSLLVYYLVNTFYVPLLHGVETQLSYFTFFCPVWHMTADPYFEYSYSYAPFQGLIWEQWYYLFAVAGIGILALALAALIYRRRQLERAGDLISVGFLRPVFLVIATIGAGAVMHAFGSLFSSTVKYVFTGVGLTVGFFAGRMLLKRTVKVFQLKAFGGLALLVAVLALSMGLTRLDPLGIVTYVPKAQQVEQVTIGVTRYSNSKVTLKDAAAIGEILELHDTLANQGDAEQNLIPLYIEYDLQGGGVVRRYYQVARNTPQAQLLNKYFSSWQCVFQTDNWEDFKSDVEKIYVAELENGLPESAYDELLEAMYRDCQAGNMAQEWLFHSKEAGIYWVEIATYEGRTQTNYISLNIYASCTNALAVLNKYAK